MHHQMMRSIPLAVGTLLDPRQDSLCHAVAVRLEDGLISEISHRPLHAQSIACVGLRGRSVTPGLTDARRHLVLIGMRRLQRLGKMPVTTVAMGGSVARPAIVRAGCFVKHAA